MTLVAARRFGDRIIVISDTMISDSNATRRNILPGRLKCIVVDWHLSIAFAGPANAGIDAIRQGHGLFKATRNLNELLDYLVAESKREPDCDKRCDFIVSSHIHEPSLYKIWDGQISSGQPFQWIGQKSLLAGLAEATDEMSFFDAFSQNAGVAAGNASQGVGGIFVVQLGSPYGHCYQTHASTICFDDIIVPPGITEQQQADRASGMMQYSYNCQATLDRGVAVVSAFFEQAQTGYIYAPLLQDDPIIVHPTSLSEICDRARLLARQLGGPRQRS